jgi:hypothetical protein
MSVEFSHQMCLFFFVASAVSTSVFVKVVFWLAFNTSDVSVSVFVNVVN